MDLLSKVRTIPDFPKKGIQFKDITTLLEDKESFLYVIDLLEKRYANRGITHVVGIESRGFIFGAALAVKLGVGFVPVRKQGKLPFQTISRAYALEYGEAIVELHSDALTSEDRVIVIDDLLATGGTLWAACELVSELGAKIEEVWVLLELAFLNGRAKIPEYSVHSEIIIEGE